MVSHLPQYPHANYLGTLIFQAIFTGSIFYFFSNHLPKEIKKLKMLLSNSNTSYLLLSEVSSIFMTILNLDKWTEWHGMEVTEFENILKNRSSDLPFRSFADNATFPNWGKFWRHKYQRLLEQMHSEFQLGDLHSAEYLKQVRFLESNIRGLDHIYQFSLYNKTLEIYLYHLRAIALAHKNLQRERDKTSKLYLKLSRLSANKEYATSDFI